MGERSGEHGATVVSTVWVLDDDGPLRRALERLLRTAGFAVQTFPSPDEMLAELHISSPDCFLLDIRLGGVNGFDVLDRVRAAGAAIPVIFITGDDDAAGRERARRVGAAGYVPKPFNDTDLLSAIDAALPRIA